MGSDILVAEAASNLLPYLDTAPDAPPIRAGIVVDSSGAPAWIGSLIQFLQNDPGINVEVLSTAIGGTEEQLRPGWLMDRLHTVSRRVFDPFAPASAPVQSVTMGELTARACDVLIWTSQSAPPDLDLRRAAKYGAFTITLGSSASAIPFWEEAANSQPVARTVIVWHEVSLGSGRAVRIAETSVPSGLYFTRVAKDPLAGILQMLGFLCLLLRHDPARAIATFRTAPEQPARRGAATAYPSTAEAARFIASKLVRSAYVRFANRGRNPNWFIAVRRNTGASVIDDRALQGFMPLPLPPSAIMAADPFLHEQDGKTWLLFEYIRVNEFTGRLGCVELLPDGTQGEFHPLLEREYHLSYPCVVSEGGELFLLPESADAHQVQLHRFTNFPGGLELVSLLAEGLFIVDTTPLFLDGIWYFFTTTASFMETLLFWSDRLDGRWRLHPSSPLSSSVKNSRSAGNLFWKDGRLFRPTQDCSVRYGYAMTVNEVLRLTPTDFEERPVTWVPPSWMPGLLGTHTWNESSQWQVVDGLR